MRKERKRKHEWAHLGLLLLILGLFAGRPIQARAAGFETINGKTYYIMDNGEKLKGWLKLGGRKYLFDKRTGVQQKGWQKNRKGQRIRYFTSGKGVMVTGFVKDSRGRSRYFYPSNGYMAKGWMKDKEGRTYYFARKSGYMFRGWAKSAGVKRYFDPETGEMTVGWRTIKGKTYYFGENGGMYANRTAIIDGETYHFSSSGAVKEQVQDGGSGEEEDLTMTVFDEKNGRNYTVMKEYATHPGVQDNTASDLDLLAALCESEAGDQGLYGMEAVALTLLNRTLDKTKGFPSSVRMVLYQGSSFPQYSVVTDGALLKRLNGQYENRNKAYKAASAAMKIFNDYVTEQKKRTIKGFKTKDFKYKYFMMESSFWKQPLDFHKVKYYKYKDHVFFVDWVSP